MTYLTTHARSSVTQDTAANERQVQNSAGGFVYETSAEQSVRRFLILGTARGTYYANESDITKQNVNFLVTYAKNYPKKLVDQIVEISTNGLAPKQSPQLFALAVAASAPETASERQIALDALNDVARTASSLFEFVSYVNSMRGWGDALRRAVSDWYVSKDNESLAYQMAKYRNRHGWTHKDVLAKAHPNPQDDEAMKALFKVATQDSVSPALPQTYKDFEKAQGANLKQAVELCENGANVSWEFFPSELHKESKFWLALLRANKLPIGALVRQLPRLSSLYIAESEEVLYALEKGNSKFLHPLSLYAAQKAYRRGSNRNLSWYPSDVVVAGLEKLLHSSFKKSQDSVGDKRIKVALDVSGSMTYPSCAGLDLSPLEAEAVMSIALAGPNTSFSAFSTTYAPISVHPRTTVKSLVGSLSNMGFGGTDCALPMLKAAANNEKYDAFVVMTDNETWAGKMHPDEALRRYREQSGIRDAKLVVGAFISTKFSIADPHDPNMLDFVGADSSLTQTVAGFVNGQV